MVKKVIAATVDPNVAEDMKRFSFNNWSKIVNDLLTKYIADRRELFEKIEKNMEGN